MLANKIPRLKLKVRGYKNTFSMDFKIYIKQKSLPKQCSLGRVVQWNNSSAVPLLEQLP